MEPWEESLDIDDSDLHHVPLLRPCKQQRCIDQSISTTATTTYIPQFQTLDSANEPETPPKSHTIPGPAGIVQAAKLRKTRDNEHPMATQEYIRQLVEDPNEDDDFKRNPWVSATEFLYDDSGMFCSASYECLGEINKFQRHRKLDQVVAIIKACTPNELGDMTVTLKDPTGSVSGTIHHKVLMEEDIRKGICVGSILILHKVSVFSPTRSTHYLNITKRNLVKVFYKDGGSSQIQALHGTIEAAPHSASNNSIHLSSQDSGRGTPSLSNTRSLERGTEGITNRMKRRNMNNEQENINSLTSNNSTIMKIARDKELLKKASDVTEKAENVLQLSGDITNGFNGGWTDEQIHELHELSVCDDF